MPTEFVNGSRPMVVGGIAKGGPGGPGRYRTVLSLAVYTIAGITRDANGVPLAGCTVDLFDTLTNTLQQTKTSGLDGSYRFAVGDAKQYYVVAYLQGTPDVSGTTTNTLVAS